MRILTHAFIFGILGLLFALAARPSAAQQTDPSNFRNESEYLLRLAEFTEWPQPPGETPRRAFNFCVLGHEQYGELLDKALLGHSVGDKRIVIVRGQHLHDMGTCDALFVGASKSHAEVDQLERKPNCAVLIIGDEPGFAAHGGMIQLVKEDGRTAFLINVDAARRAGLKISASLLALATVVYDRPANGAN
ncbi:MAG TPA: YfiR family protein [Candidatus Acidoferrales bacterium]|nr:YfiR family protein [Candidatus Acidoferrales bacterium]